MEKQRRMFSIILVLLTNIAAGQGQSGGNDNVRYFQVSGTKNQRGGPNAAAVQYDSIDGSNGITSSGNSSFVFSDTGIYFALFGGQIGSPNKNGRGEVHVWIRESTSNAPNTLTDVANTNAIQTVERGATSVLVFNNLFRSFAGYTTALAFSAFTTNKCSTLGLITTRPDNESVVPSIISSIVQVSEGVDQSSYAQLSSSETQLGSSTSKAVTLNSFTLVNNIDTTTTSQDGTIKCNRSGLYFAIASAQVGNAVGASATGDVHLWIRLNGQDVPNSNTIQTIRQGATAVLVNQIIISLQANDKLQMMFSSTNTKLGLIASTSTNEPAVPSMIFSTYQLDSKRSSIPYAQLVSLKTQFGCLTPTTVQFDQSGNSQNIQNNNGTITFNESGTYLLIAAAQAGSCRQRGIGDVHLWMRVNGQDVANSNTVQTVKMDTGVLISQAVLAIKAGDQVQMLMSTDVTKGTLGLMASEPANEPAVPSIIFSAYKAVI